MTTPEEIFICPSAALQEGGLGKRFPVQVHGDETTGFVVRYGGVVYGYLNRCAHVPIELDWAEGEFFESSGLYLMCATHGAVYAPDTGKCAGGPCTGAHLRKIMAVERDGQVFWRPDDIVQPVEA
ncbi:Rieske (2Fe-2S) protein [Herbaspirillum huttiense]|jgi:nitrite reductase/ring-hydroxylating ferredoxin subunit|uniref:Rieske (2Fe-2S) protein n=3 Tax=Herbaspirillum TaxID=963 RepID=A0AAJ2H849_9BURK|nr:MULTISPECIES: Rieske (2Fe-2S) protein [Herbaspirillum]MBW9332606.1 Rieske (2Fe-2S) protein [Herbaspirillum sp. RU 5E]MAF01045.1 Rieske (2Fe-2S) protein [Herbaspirillum sp.]MBN9356060.1 Rieske (2Fe-2S) protein [Herbaspirillum huttiense]MBO15461.1 Rieske (2Fe-2S) protein [Herbaspirillum sp.]MBP1316294.1 nitrite reductase/ring-hydroxylating ferredoxin subunit [Herbaspirillum sp. 1130]|tara:strand:+ start:79 stop:453 length:375 start_codon:yes stop_codon:yes gene_type:complete